MDKEYQRILIFDQLYKRIENKSFISADMCYNTHPLICAFLNVFASIDWIVISMYLL